MAILADEDGSEDVNDFLKRIKELGEQRDREDEERNRKLEEEIIQGRKERQARRAERARSLSPKKDANAETPSSIRSENSMSIQEDFSRVPILQPPTPSPSSGPEDTPQKINGPTNGVSLLAEHGEVPQVPLKTETISEPSPSSALPSRSGTLSWQQRPLSRGSMGPRSLPPSILSLGNNSLESPDASVEAEAVKDDAPLKSRIAQSLGSKDPEWFRQTQERGLGSAALRRNQEDVSDTSSAKGTVRLPGMSRESTAEPEGRLSPPPDTLLSKSASAEGSVRSRPGTGLDFLSSTSKVSSGDGMSPLPSMDSQRFKLPSSNIAFSRGGDVHSSFAPTLSTSQSQGRIAPERMERPISPTKGLGGFVQSAMMKRSDSVSKRWSAQAGPGLSRGSSIASNRSGYEPSKHTIGGITPFRESRPNSMSREASPATNSRPSSSHSNTTVTQSHAESERLGSSVSISNSEFISEPTTKGAEGPHLRGSKSPPPLSEVMSPPTSPSKKWSPTKSSWLENALNKPDSPKVRSLAPQQPSWMSEINRAKQQRSSVDLAKGGHFKEVTIGGLVRSPPPGTGYKPPTLGGLPAGFNASTAPKLKPKPDVSNAPTKNELSHETVNGITASRALSPSPLQRSEQLRGESQQNWKSIAETSSEEAKVSSSTSSDEKASQPSPYIQLSNPNPKPETPPKKDFAANLKPRQSTKEIRKIEEPEFKNVFGTLKRTKTQNYVAPDEFKDNILRGKAGLAQTGGPKKSERRDDFKESILQKKQGMVAPSASTRITSASSSIADQSIREALAKRQGLTRSEGTLSTGSTSTDKEPLKSEAISKLQNPRDKSRQEMPEKNSSGSAEMQKASSSADTSGQGFASSLASILQKGPSPIISDNTPILLPSSNQNIDIMNVSEPSIRETASAAPQLTHATKMRAKGPKRRLPTSNREDASSSGSIGGIDSQPKAQLAENKAPDFDLSLKPQRLSFSDRFEVRPLSSITGNHNTIRKTSQPASPRKSSRSIAHDVKTSLSTSEVPLPETKSKPPQIVKQKPNSSLDGIETKKPSLSASIPQPDTPLKRPYTQVSALGVGEPSPNDQAPNRSSETVKSTAAIWNKPETLPQSIQLQSPLTAPAAKKENVVLGKIASDVNEPVGLGIKTLSNGPQPSLDRNLPSPATPSPKSPPLPGRKSTSIVNRIVSANLPPPATAGPTAQMTPVADFFTDIFDESPNSQNKVEIDTQGVIDSSLASDSSQKIKTLRKQIFEVTGQGKLTPVPSQQEHILFENTLYLCTHVFGTFAGQRKTEVYLWCGDGVASSSVEDAQLFAKRTAKDNGGKLIVLKQGKETPNFFQALGGIVITRRGSSSRADSSRSGAAYVLCGRQHVGHIAFDEVAFAPSSLCSGFPYIVSASDGKLYLWKGRGSGADELGCARLIGMDLGLTGEIEEIDEGKEPASFWGCFAGGQRDANSANGTALQNWHLKPSCEGYSTRLFVIDVETPRPKSGSGFMQWGRRGSTPSNDAGAALTAKITEMAPFAQFDLVYEKVFVLDAFFEIFVILPLRTLTPAAQHRSINSLAFRAALLFAQEYGILAASAQDRPFVPASSVVICSRELSKDTEGGKVGVGIKDQEIPEGMRTAFRKWDEDLVGCCRVIPLQIALEACGKR